MELDLQDWIVEAFLVKRDNRASASNEDYLKVDQLNINDDNLKNRFKEILKNFLCDESDNLTINLDDFHSYMSDDSKQKNYKIKKEDIDDLSVYFENITSSILDEDSENDVANEDFSKYYALVIKFSHGSQKIITLRKLKRVIAGNYVGGIFDGSVREVVNDLLFVDDSVDFIYFDNLNAGGRTSTERNRLNKYTLVYNRRNFEVIFRIDEYRITKSKEFFDKYSFIEVADIETDKEYEDGTKVMLKDDIIEDGRLNSQIARINNVPQDQVTFDKIREIKEERGDKYSFTVENDKIRIDDKAHIKDLLDLIDEKIGTPEWNRNKLVRYPNKGDDL